jgi:hypothetical protein
MAFSTIPTFPVINTGTWQKEKGKKKEKKKEQLTPYNKLSMAKVTNTYGRKRMM